MILPSYTLSAFPVMHLNEIMDELAAMANPSTKKTYLRHGAPEPVFGVKIGDMKKLLKKLKGQQDLALQLYATGNTDAMYLAGLVADGAQMTFKQLDSWAAGASWSMIAGCTVPWVAAEHPKAIEIACKWIDSSKELVATAGWSTLASVVATVADANLPLKTLEALLERCRKTIHSSANRARYAMSSFVISCGTYVGPLADQALQTARQIGPVEIDMGNTDCKVPEAASYILKCRRGAPVAPKRKSPKC